MSSFASAQNGFPSHCAATVFNPWSQAFTRPLDLLLSQNGPARSATEFQLLANAIFGNGLAFSHPCIGGINNPVGARMMRRAIVAWEGWRWRH